MDTVDANRRLGFKDDERTYECVEPILRDMGLKVRTLRCDVIMIFILIL